METINKGLRLLLITVAVFTLVCVAFVAGYISGIRMATPALVVEKTIEIEQSPVEPVVTLQVQRPATPEKQAGRENLSTLQDTFDLYEEVWGVIERDFYGDLPDEQERMDGAIRGSLQTLDDDYTSYIEPDAADIMRDDLGGSFEGIGALVNMNELNQIVIERPMPGQPAEIAGLEAGDIILAVDGQSLEGMGIYEAISLIRGPQDTVVVLTIQRSGELEPHDVEVTRAKIPLPTIESEMLDGNIAYIRLYEFNGQATNRLKEALEELLADNPVGIILDLRDNPGGYLTESVSVADQFLPDGVVLYERSTEGQETIFESTNRGLADDVPLVVLINQGSASASEIVAGAIQDRDRAPLVGETSFGKGSVQQAHQLSNGGELRVTIARWFTPDEQPIHGNGLVPDYQVPYTEEDYQAGLDPQLEKAVEILLEGE
ncbi:MAG: S41 family peptidase [Anaerolineales bacterium]|nr:S41 family peptidase [Anaerolineales bacterium]